MQYTPSTLIRRAPNFELEPTCTVLLHREKNAGRKLNWLRATTARASLFSRDHIFCRPRSGLNTRKKNYARKVLLCPRPGDSETRLLILLYLLMVSIFRMLSVCVRRNSCVLCAANPMNDVVGRVPLNNRSVPTGIYGHLAHPWSRGGRRTLWNKHVKYNTWSRWLGFVSLVYL